VEETRMDQKKKLSVVIEHWIEHNESHKDEYKRWAQTAGELGLDSVKTEIEEAVEKLSQSNQHLEKALKAISS
jgi:t-SNARE complex subunit (syntaxin)